MYVDNGVKRTFSQLLKDFKHKYFKVQKVRSFFKYYNILQVKHSSIDNNNQIYSQNDKELYIITT